MKLFLPQSTLEEWALGEKADLKDGRLMVAETKQAYDVKPAVHFRKCVSGTDERKLLAKVKTSEALEALGAEQMADSVLLGETAYEVTPGYVAEVPLPTARTGAKKGSPETDLLAAFLLDKL